jgi:hypothetical protein
MLSAMVLFIIGFFYGFAESSEEESTKRAQNGLVWGFCALVIWVFIWLISSEKLL